MLKLLRIEWMKLKHYRTFWILSALYLISIVGLNFIVFYVQQRIFEEKQSKGLAELVIGNRPYSFPTVWQMTSYVSGFLLFLPGLLIFAGWKRDSLKGQISKNRKYLSFFLMLLVLPLIGLLPACGGGGAPSSVVLPTTLVRRASA